MQAVILVGGEGTRLRPLTYDIPKPMAPILGKPYLEWLITALKESGIKEIILAACFKFDVIKDYFGNGESFGVKIFYEVETEPLGTAGAVKNVEKHIKDAFLVFNGDVMIDIDFRKLIEFHKKNKGMGALTLTKVLDPSRYGIIETNEDKSIKRFIEKPPPDQITSNYINAGVYVLEKKVLDLMKPGANYSFERQIFPQILQSEDNLFAYHNDGYWIDIGKPESYTKVQFDILEGKFKFNMNGYGLIKKSVWAGKDVFMDKSVKINPFVFIDDGAQINSNCEIGPHCVIGKNSVLGENSHISETILWEGAKVGKGVKLKNCIAGRFVNILDKAEISQGNIIASGETVK